MQPYFLPYIGYFQIVAAVDFFVFYDDVQFIKGGWINRNRIIINDEPKYLTIPIQDASSNKLIRETLVKKSQKEFLLLEKKIEQCYKKAPFFAIVFPLIQSILQGEYTSISELSISSIKIISKYLEIPTEFFISSEKFSQTKGYKRSERLAEICHKLSADTYINPVGGKNLYDKDEFAKMGIRLQFLKSNPHIERQINNSWLNVSILHLIMYYSPYEVKRLLGDYEIS